MSDAAAPQTTPASAADIRPIVAGSSSNRSIWVSAIALGVGAGALFAALEARRQTLTAPAVIAPADINAGMIASPPELAIPEAAPSQDASVLPRYAGPAYAALQPAQPVIRESPVRVRASAPDTGGAAQAPAFAPPAASAISAQPAPSFSGPKVVYQATANPRSTATGQAGTSDQTGKSPDRVLAGRLENPSTTVPKGTLVQAVLETALDSTRAGAARAIITQDVRGFDGSRILIPRGSRLYGEYKADLAAGQNRALIQWQRLLRPDGVTINLDSPSADPLGRAGVKGKVNTHFFARFSGAILQTGLTIGTNLATQSVSNQAFLIALPGSAQALAPQVAPADIKPTLKIRQGTSVSVFVARDLDFSSVEP